MKWWRMGCCWSPAGSALVDDPAGTGMEGYNTKHDCYLLAMLHCLQDSFNKLYALFSCQCTL